jgi:hypothetical protein
LSRLLLSRHLLILVKLLFLASMDYFLDSVMWFLHLLRLQFLDFQFLAASLPKRAAWCLCQ